MSFNVRVELIGPKGTRLFCYPVNGSIGFGFSGYEGGVFIERGVTSAII